MKFYIASSCLLIGIQLAVAQEQLVFPRNPTMMDHAGAPIDKESANLTSPDISHFTHFGTNLPLERLSDLSKHVFKDDLSWSRSAKDAALYRAISPSVVLIVAKDSLGSGSLISSTGDILTNWHVIKGASDIVVIFKPAAEGREPTKDDIKAARVVKYDSVADLALVKAAEVPKGRNPIRVGDGSDISVGIDVHAIGHPYTKGVISQYRPGFDWTTGDTKHKADVIQTQTPINPGNSGGPLLDDNGLLLGVNTFKATGEGLNFAVSADEVKRFVGRVSNERSDFPKATCEAKEISRFRNKDNAATVISYDTRCAGRADANYTIPDNKAEAITLSKDRNGDGRIDVMYFDFKRQGKWDLSFWDETYSGRWTLVGYHLDGSITPTQFESYEIFQRRTASR